MEPSVAISRPYKMYWGQGIISLVFVCRTPSEAFWTSFPALMLIDFFLVLVLLLINQTLSFLIGTDLF